MSNLKSLRLEIRKAAKMPEAACLDRLHSQVPVKSEVRKATQDRAVKLVTAIRADSDPSLMEVFLAEYGLSTDEGVA
ncbi:MAG: RHH-type proline utilization regulon transcriptional repressor/proline dehydrogenase, partial [Planctomycetota bacterium]